MMTRSRNFSTKLLAVLIIWILSLLVTSSLALAQEEAQLYLEPVELSEDSLLVEVIAGNVADLYGAEIKLTYDPAVMRVKDADPKREGIQIEAGQFLPVSQGFVVVNQVDEAEGTITYAITLLNPAPPANGTGPLARVAFDILPGAAAKLETSTIEIEKSKLVASNLQTIPNQAPALELGSQLQPKAAAASAASTEAKPAPIVIDTSPVTSTKFDFIRRLVAGGAVILAALSIALFGLVSAIVIAGRRFNPKKLRKRSSRQFKSMLRLRIQRPQLLRPQSVRSQSVRSQSLRPQSVQVRYNATQSQQTIPTKPDSTS